MGSPLVGGPWAGRGGTDPVASTLRNIGGVSAAHATRVEALTARAEATGDPAMLNAALNARTAVANATSHEHLVPTASQLGTHGHRGTQVEIGRQSPLTLPAGLRPQYGYT
jgi:hypothetical protein